jgi:hypothetical protein
LGIEANSRWRRHGEQTNTTFILLWDIYFGHAAPGFATIFAALSLKKSQGKKRAT